MAMPLVTEPYSHQRPRWPASGRFILAQHDASTVVVYQAYRRAIAEYAVKHQQFGGEFSFSRMSWIKPNFLWMMFRSGWGTKPGQECVLAVRLRRAGFDEILAQAVPSSFAPDCFSSEEEWHEAVARSPVRLQWDPDHDPSGNPVGRRAIQLGLRGDVLARYARDWIVEIHDISGFVAEQRGNAASKKWEQLRTPKETVYECADPSTARRLGVSRAVTLYRPVGPKELQLIQQSGFHWFPARLPGQPVFYPVLDESYAKQIARDWNVKESGSGFVTRFQVDASFLSRYEIQTVGAPHHREYWIPADDLDAFNHNIIGAIEVIDSFS